MKWYKILKRKHDKLLKRWRHELFLDKWYNDYINQPEEKE